MSKDGKDDNSAGAAGGLGCFVAVFLSAALNHSFWWGVLHFLCGWIYVAYALIFRFREIRTVIGF